MKEKKRLHRIVLSLLAFGSASIASANVPPPPVNQIIGIPDGVYGNYTESQCRNCHGGPTNTASSSLADRHHLRVGTPVQAVSDAPATSATGYYECLSCHSLVLNSISLTQEFLTRRDCLICHGNPTGISPHHRAAASVNKDCTACHRHVDRPDDGHYIPADPLAADAPKMGMGAGPNGQGGCAYCHYQGVDQRTGLVIYVNASTHHAIAPNNYNECLFCHDPSGIAPIRVCQKCHGINSLHKIQVDSDGDGLISPGEESPGYGHIGRREDCQGCHYQGAPTTAIPFEAGPAAPELDVLSRPSMTQGIDTVITMQGSSLVDFVENADGTFTKVVSNVALSDRFGLEIMLTPAQAAENELTLSVPSYLKSGSYAVRLIKGDKRSDVKNIAVRPSMTVHDVSCDPRVSNSLVTIQGGGFGAYYYGMGLKGSGIGVTTDLGVCMVNNWSDTQITAVCDVNCGSQVEVTSFLGTVAAPMGSALQICATCHGDNKSLVNCRNKKWREHLRRNLVSRAVYELAETIYLGGLCSSTVSGTPKDRTRK